MAAQAGIKIYPISTDPLKFPEAVLIGNRQDYYGESQFKINSQSQHHLKMQAKLFNRLLGEFSPSRSDLVFAKTGDFMGIMANKQNCVLIDNFLVTQKIILGTRFDKLKAEATLSKLRNRLISISKKL